MLRRVVRDNMKRLSALDDPGNALVDRRIVVKLLLTYFERDQAHEVLQLMARILGFSGEPSAFWHVSLGLHFSSTRHDFCSKQLVAILHMAAQLHSHHD